jgi:hypothetical protein
MSTSSYSCGGVDSAPGNLSKSKSSLSSSTELLSQPDVMKRDCFELLSAYLDGEVTAKERAIVQNWLQTDPSVYSLYNRLMNLRHGFRQEGSPEPSRVEFTIAGVFNRLGYRLRMVTMATAGVLFLATLNTLSGGLSLNLGSISPTVLSKSQSLEVTVEQPVFPIPRVSSQQFSL